MADEYTATFAKFILSCKHEYEQLCETIENGDVPAGHAVTMTIRIPADDVDRIRFDQLAKAARNGG